MSFLPSAFSIQKLPGLLATYFRRYPLVWPIVVLLLSSVFGVVLLAARIAISRHPRHLYLPWNLFLAWVPVFLAFGVRYLERVSLRWPMWLVGAAWLLFLPNAPYLLTDLIHLPHPSHRHYFADLMLILHFALVGLGLGFVSLHLMHDVVERRCGWFRGWVFAVVVAGLTGLGIYFGRFLRWNSWDVLMNPWGLANDLAEWGDLVFDRPSELILPALFGSTTLVAYALFSSFLRPSLPRTEPCEISDRP